MCLFAFEKLYRFKKNVTLKILIWFHHPVFFEVNGIALCYKGDNIKAL